MKNKILAQDYIRRARSRLAAVAALMRERSWADVVRESQEVVELALKALLRRSRIEVPRAHDVSAVLEAQKQLFSAGIQKALERLCRVSHSMRRDRELSFYGSEDLTPSQFYSRKDAAAAQQDAEWVVGTVEADFAESGEPEE